MKDHDIISKYELRTAAAQRPLAKVSYDANVERLSVWTTSRRDTALTDEVAVSPTGDVAGIACAVVSSLAIQVKADATNSIALQKKKVHLSLVRQYLSTVPLDKLTINRIDDSLCEGGDTTVYSSPSITYAKHMPCMQEADATTGEEMYRLLKSELDSIGQPSWDSYRDDPTSRLIAVANVLLISAVLWMFGFDAGPDYVGFCRFAKKSLANCCYQMMFFNHCVLHRYQL